MNILNGLTQLANCFARLLPAHIVSGRKRLAWSSSLWLKTLPKVSRSYS